MADHLQTAQPLEARFELTLPRHLARRTDSPAVGVQPQADQQLRVRVFPPGAAFDRCNLRMIETQVQSPHHFPKRTRTVILVDQLLNIDRAQQDLPAINGNQSRSRRRHRILHTCSVRTFVDSAILLRSPSVDFFTASSRRFRKRESRNQTRNRYIPEKIIVSKHASPEEWPLLWTP